MAKEGRKVGKGQRVRERQWRHWERFFSQNPQNGYPNPDTLAHYLIRFGRTLYLKNTEPNTQEMANLFMNMLHFNWSKTHPVQLVNNQRYGMMSWIRALENSFSRWPQWCFWAILLQTLWLPAQKKDSYLFLYNVKFACYHMLAHLANIVLWWFYKITTSVKGRKRFCKKNLLVILLSIVRMEKFKEKWGLIYLFIV